MARIFSFKNCVALAGLATLATVFVLGTADSALAGLVRHSPPGNLSNNECVPPVVTQNVGGGVTYISYPPLAPQEFSCKHCCVYKTKNDDGTRTRTHVHWW
jgi:hypothetical protein